MYNKTLSKKSPGRLFTKTFNKWIKERRHSTKVHDGLKQEYFLG